MYSHHVKTNSVDPGQLASDDASCSGSTWFSIRFYNFENMLTVSALIRSNMEADKELDRKLSNLIG